MRRALILAVAVFRLLLGHDGERIVAEMRGWR